MQATLLYLKDKVLDTLQAGGRLEHTDLAHVFAAEALRANGDLHLVARDDLGVQHSRGVVAGVAAANRVLNNGLSQIALVVTAAHALVYGFRKVAADEVHVLADLKEYAGHAGILADRNALVICNFKIFDDVVQNTLCDLAVFAGAARADGALYVLRQVLVCRDAQLLNNVCDLADFNFTHGSIHSFPEKIISRDERNAAAAAGKHPRIRCLRSSALLHSPQYA